MSKTEWGNATWYLIHTLSFKLKNTENNHVPNLFTELVHIATNLPCPDCSQHAKMYINNINSIPRNRDELNMFFWGMHNWVNNKLHKSQYPSNNYIAKYNLAYTPNVIKNYINKKFSGNYGSTDNFQFPISHTTAKKWLKNLI